MPWLTLLQIALLLAWYTALPGLPWWLVFLPLLMGAAALGLMLAFLAIVTALGFAVNK